MDEIITVTELATDTSDIHENWANSKFWCVQGQEWTLMLHCGLLQKVDINIKYFVRSDWLKHAKHTHLFALYC